MTASSTSDRFGPPLQGAAGLTESHLRVPHAATSAKVTRPNAGKLKRDMFKSTGSATLDD